MLGWVISGEQKQTVILISRFNKFTQRTSFLGLLLALSQMYQSRKNAYLKWKRASILIFIHFGDWWLMMIFCFSWSTCHFLWSYSCKSMRFSYTNCSSSLKYKIGFLLYKIISNCFWNRLFLTSGTIYDCSI